MESPSLVQQISTWYAETNLTFLVGVQAARESALDDLLELEVDVADPNPGLVDE